MAPFSLLAQEDNGNVEIYMFVQQGCPHCAQTEKTLDEWKESKYPGLNVKKFDIVNRDNLLLFLTTQKAYDFESQGVPTLFIGQHAIVGEKYNEIEDAINECLEKSCPQPSEIIQNYIDRQGEGENATKDQAANDTSSQTDKASKNLIVAGIIIIAIVCGFIIYRVFGKKK